MTIEKKYTIYIEAELRNYLRALTFADRVQMIHKLLKLIVETLDGMEAEVKRECP